jgi:GntR family transcriptional regulator, arabinose operon transcriptional repressor
MKSAEDLFQYQEIARVLADQIARGEFDGTGRLPSERVLLERFNVQRNTVRRALALLETEGRISIEGKRGSYLKLPGRHEGGKTFLLCVHGGSSPNLARLCQGFIRASADAGFSVRALDSHPREGAALDSVPDASALDSDVAGVVLWPQNPTNVEALRRIKNEVPLVLVDRRVIGLSSDCVRFADAEGGRMVAEHLIERGHRRIAFIADEVFAETVQQRWRGYVMAQESAGIPIDPRLSLFFHGIDNAYVALALRYILTLGADAPTAIMCSNDLVAFHLLRFLHDETVRVPEDLAVTGYGNMLPDYVSAMALTSVDQPFYELGQAAAKILVDRIGHPTSERIQAPREVEIPVKLIVRGSTSQSPRSVRSSMAG